MNKPERYDAVVAINVDIQNDFCPGGALPVPEGDTVVPVMNRVNDWVRDQNASLDKHIIWSDPPQEKGAVIFTADWHPEDTEHFEVNGGPWPVHCVQNKAGAAFHDELKIKDRDTIARKGMSKKDDGYSGWPAKINDGPLYSPGDGRNYPSVESVSRGVERLARIFDARGHYNERPKKVALLIGGLATDYCVKATVLDALGEQEKFPAFAKQLGVFVVDDAIRGVELQPGDSEKAVEEMKAAGAKFVTSEDILAGKVVEVA